MTAFCIKKLVFWCHDIQNNNMQHKNIQKSSTQHNDSQHNVLKCDTTLLTLSITALSILIKCHHSECCYAQYRFFLLLFWLSQFLFSLCWVYWRQFICYYSFEHVPVQCPQKPLAHFDKVVNYKCKMFMKSTTEVEGDPPGVNLVKLFMAVIYHLILS